jgi:hypothetical protein
MEKHVLKIKVFLVSSLFGLILYKIPNLWSVRPTLEIFYQSESSGIITMVSLLNLIIYQIITFKILIYLSLSKDDKNDNNYKDLEGFYRYSMIILEWTFMILFIFFFVYSWVNFAAGGGLNQLAISNAGELSNAGKLGVYVNINRVLIVLYPASGVYLIYQYMWAMHKLKIIKSSIQ